MKFTTEQDKYIKRHKNKRAMDIAKVLGVSERHVAYRRQVLGICNIPKSRWTRAEDELVLCGLDEHEIAHRLGRTVKAVQMRKFRLSNDEVTHYIEVEHFVAKPLPRDYKPSYKYTPISDELKCAVRIKQILIKIKHVTEITEGET